MERIGGAAGFLLEQRAEVFPLTMDTLLLGDFVTLRRGDRVYDLGCGSGALGLLMLARSSNHLTYTGIDCQAASCALTEGNLRRNGLEGTVLPADLRRWQELPANCADAVVSNPPYYSPARGAAAPGERGTARGGCQPEELCRSAARLLVNGGRFALIWRTERLAELFRWLGVCGLEPKRLRLVQHRWDTPPKLALVESVLQGGVGLTAEPALVLYDPDGRESAEYRRIYFMEN